ncbi:MAG TPA: asparagine synthase C-terminal domain-containing protein [Pyrinomonadaceae bacterium]|nr:asparagine synthase C-terminal domain-containing protein [Pyrinomonadaceae bacterium]
MEKFFRAKFSDSGTETFGDFRVSLGNKSCNVFAEWTWNGETLTLTNDRHGFFPVYYFCDKNEFAVSSSIEKLLEIAGKIEFDENALALFLRLGWLVGDDTIFKNIRALAPESVLTWEKGVLKIESKEILAPKTLNISRREAIETYAELFQKAIEKTVPPNKKFIVPLSGGRDSRHITFALHKANLQPLACATILHPPPRANEDARIAAKVCESLNLKHILLEQNRPRAEAEIYKNKKFGYSVYEHAWFLALADYVSKNPCVIYDGIAGDVLSAGHFLTDKRLKLFREENFHDLAEDILEAEGYIPKILTKNLYAIYSRERAVNHLIEELVKYKNHPNPVGAFYFYSRTRRCIAPVSFSLLGDSVQVVMPYLETEVFDFLSALPVEMFLNHEFHTETIFFAFPEFANIPFEEKTAPLVPDTEYFRRFSRDVFKFSRTPRNRQMTNPMFFLSRFLRASVDKKYSRAVVEYGEQAIHLLQLERI